MENRTSDKSIIIILSSKNNPLVSIFKNSFAELLLLLVVGIITSNGTGALGLSESEWGSIRISKNNSFRFIAIEIQGKEH